MVIVVFREVGMYAYMYVCTAKFNVFDRIEAFQPSRVFTLRPDKEGGELNYILQYDK